MSCCYSGTLLLMFCAAFLGYCISSGFMTGVLSVILPSHVSVSLECLCPYIFGQWSTILLNLSSVCDVLFFDISFLRYSSAVIGVDLMSLLALVMRHPILVTLILWLLPWWSSDPCPAIVSGIQCPPSSFCTATVDPMGRKGTYVSSYIFFVYGCIFVRAA